MLYGSETRTIAQEEQRRIETFEIWCYRRMLKISWTDMVIIQEVLERMPKRRTLWNSTNRKEERNGLDIYCGMACSWD